jgi:hypothetical protein
MNCRACDSDEQRVFEAEIPVVFPRIEDRAKPIVWVFPRLLICLACGYTEFVVPKAKLQVIRDNAQT